MKPVVSVLLPVYNGEAYLKPAMESVLSQTFGDWELFVGDNASTDGTRDILESYRDPRIRIHRHATNTGLTPNWDFLLHNARGDYACILGADDLFYSAHLEKKVALLRNCPGAAFVHGLTDLINAEGKVWQQTTPPPEAREERDDLLRLLLKGNFLNIISIVFPLETVRKHNLHFESRFELMPDWHLWIALLLLSKQFCYDKQVTAAYRVHGDSITSRHINSFAWAIQGVELRLDLLRRFPNQWRATKIDPEFERSRITKGLWALAFQQMRRRHWPEAKRAWKNYRECHTIGEVFWNAPSHFGERLWAKFGGKEISP
jgi:glycosyltransferase involved in cell wall biosynthesis